MAILTHKCPHCLTEHMGLRVVQVVWGSEWNAAVYLTCPKCDRPSCAIMYAPEQGAPQANQLMGLPGDLLQVDWSLADFWPEPPRPVIPDHLPPEVERAYTQAERNFATEHNEEPAGMMYRKALDLGLKRINPALAGMLGQKITALANSGRLTPDMVDWSRHVSALGAEAAHDADPIARRDLVDLRSFTEMVLRYLFTLPGMVKKRRGQRLDWEPDEPANPQGG